MPTKTRAQENLDTIKTIGLATFSFIGLFGHSIGNNIPHWEKQSTRTEAIYADAHCLPARRKYLPLDNVSAWDTGMAEQAYAECIYRRQQEMLEKYPDESRWVRYYMVYDPISGVTSRVSALDK